MATRSQKLSGSAASVLEYLQDETRTLDYYSDRDDGLAFGETWGELGRELGLEHGITTEQFGELFSGRWQGEKVTGSGYRKRVDPVTKQVVVEAGVRTKAIDITFAVPKGVSELIARAKTDADAKAISDAIFQAAKVAFREGVEGHARVARVYLGKDTQGRKMYEAVTAKMVCTPVLQFTARPTEETERTGAPADPHAHVHCTTMTAAKVGDKWYTIDEAGIRRTAEFRNQIFMGELARGLESLGIELDYTSFEGSRKGRISFEPKASNPALRRFWSKNHARRFDIERDFEREHHRVPADWELTALMTMTRGKKADKAMDSRPTRSRWLDDARANGFSAPLFSLSPHRPRTPMAREEELWSRLMGANGFTKEDATFSSESIKLAIARAAVGLHFTPEARHAYEAQIKSELIKVRSAEPERFALFTTAAQVAREEWITATRHKKAATVLPAVPDEIVEQAIAAQPVELDAEQRRGVQLATSECPWVHIEGYAGSGKTTLLAAVRDAHLAAGTVDRVIVVSTAAGTAERTAKRLGVSTWGPVESIVLQMNGQRPSDKTLWFVDEAAMMDADRMAKLLDVIGPGRVVLVGDGAQLSAIGAAGWYSESVQEHGSLVLTKVHRHRDEGDVRDYELLRLGKTDAALAGLQERGRVHIDPSMSDRVERVLRDYRNMRDYGYGAHQVRQVVETSNYDVDRLNRFIQQERLERGEISHAHLDVDDVEQARTWRIHEGDQVIFLRSHRQKGSPTIRNGASGTVLSIDPQTRQVRVALDDRVASLRLEVAEMSQPLGLAYAQHAHKLQGGEVEMVQVLPGHGRMTNANSGYSQLTRATHEAHIYLDQETHGDAPVAALAQSWATAEVKRSALWHLRRTALTRAGKPTQDQVSVVKTLFGGSRARTHDVAPPEVLTQAAWPEGVPADSLWAGDDQSLWQTADDSAWTAPGAGETRFPPSGPDTPGY